jgi:transglutaminase-like putative cysteine protease
VIYSIRHLTTYTYEAPVASATMVLRLRPRSDQSQRVIDYKVEIEPRPDRTRENTDFFRNAVAFATIEAPHTELQIKSSVQVEVQPAAPLLIPDAGWTNVAADALQARELSPSAPAHFLFASPRIALSASITDYVRKSFTAKSGIVECCRDLLVRMKADFEYKPQTTDISTPLSEVFLQRRGVCQDFAHLMISGLRGLGVPAAYVSGYLRTKPPPGKERLQGADATHAWVSVWGGPHIGWIGFDPTNAVQTAEDHITLAVGRDFSDVSPVYGVFVGSGENRLRVAVDVVPVTDTRM